MSSTLRPILYAFDPAGIFLQDQHPKEHFSFLRKAISEDVPGLENVTVFDPRTLGRDAEEAAAELMDEIEAASAKDQGLLPEEMRNPTNLGLMAKKRKEIFETAVTVPMHMFASGNRKRARIIAKTSVFILLHDDVCESSSAEQGSTIIDDAFSDLIGAQPNGEEAELWKNHIFRKFAKEVLEEAPLMGQECLESILVWAQFTRSKPPKQNMTFSTLNDYIEYRIKDIAVEFMHAAVKFTCGVDDLTEADKEPLAHLRRLYVMHFSLTNDLYSFEKECCEHVQSGMALVNAVKVLQDLLSASPSTAKIVLRTVLWDLENQIHDEYKKLVDAGTLKESQLRFASGMIECLAGNIYYSATTHRYARMVPGAAFEKN